MEDSNSFDQAMTPAAAVAILKAKGINLAERTLREYASRIGACRIIGKTMFLMPADIEQIIEAAKPEPKQKAAAGAYVSSWTDADTDALLERLEGGAGNKPRTGRRRSA